MGTVYELMFIAASLLLYDMTISSNKIQPIILSSNAASIQPCSAGIFLFCFTVLDSARKFRTMWACTKILVFFALLCMINQYGWMQHFFSIAEIGRKTTWKNGRWIVKSFLFYEIIVVVSIWFRLRSFSVVVSSSFVIT